MDASVTDPNVIHEFVAHSNRIEGEPTEAGPRLYDDHFEAALLVASRALAGERALGPRGIHEMIMSSQPEAWPGRYRDSHVYVAGEQKVPPEDVRRRMRNVRQRANRAGTAEAIWSTHLEFEAIHPFRDGNGRSGRLWLNEVRIRAGLPWLIVRFEERFDYFAEIRNWGHAYAWVNGEPRDPPLPRWL